MKQILFSWLLLLASNYLWAQNNIGQLLYPAEYGDKTGFINDSGKVVIKPKYLKWSVRSKDKSFYFMAQKGEKGLDLICVDLYGKEFLKLKDTLKQVYQTYQLKKGGDFYKIENEIRKKKGTDTIPIYVRNPDDDKFWNKDKPDSISRSGNYYKLFYTLGNQQFGFVEYLGADLYLVNIAGYTSAKFEHGYRTRSGCVIRDVPDKYVNKRVIGGRWFIVDSKLKVYHRLSQGLSYKNVKSYRTQWLNRYAERYMNFFYTKLEYSDSTIAYRFFNRKGEQTFYAKDKNLYLSISNHGKFIAVKFAKSYKTQLKTILFDFEGNTIDTFKKFYPRGYYFMGTRKDTTLEFYNLNRKSLYHFAIPNTKETIILDSHRAYQQINDSTCRLYNFKDENFHDYPFSRISNCSGDFCIGELERNRKYFHYLINSSSDSIIISGRNYLSFTSCKSYMNIPDQSGVNYIYSVNSNIKNDKPISKLFKANNSYIRSSFSNYLLDTALNGREYIKEPQVEALKNDFILLIEKDYSSWHKYKLLYKFEDLNLEFQGDVVVHDFKSSSLTVISYSDYVYIHFAGENKFLKIKTESYSYPGIEEIHDMIKLHVGYEHWIYINSRGELVYNSKPSKEVPVSYLSAKQLKRDIKNLNSADE